MLDTALDFLCGCFSGLSQLVKVRLINQSSANPEYNGIYDCFRKIIQQEGMLAFYKGALVPFLGVGVQVAMQFGPNQLVKRALKPIADDAQQVNGQDSSNNNILTMQLVFLAGILTGLPSSLTVTPIDFTKILLQNQKGDDKRNRYHGSVDAGIQIYKKYGIRGLYQGFYPTLLRESVSLPIYFSTYEKTLRMLIDDDDTSQAPVLASFFVGGFSGIFSWLFTYPIDYVKTLIQSQCPQNKKYSSAIQCAKIRFKEQGPKTFFKGLGVTLCRSFPVNGVGFFSFELAMRATGRKQIFSDDDEFSEFY